MVTRKNGRNIKRDIVIKRMNIKTMRISKSNSSTNVDRGVRHKRKITDKPKS